MAAISTQLPASHRSSSNHECKFRGSGSAAVEERDELYPAPQRMPAPGTSSADYSESWAGETGTSDRADCSRATANSIRPLSIAAKKHQTDVSASR